LKTHPDANQNTSILWNESVNGRDITCLKGPGGSLAIKHRYDAVTVQLVPLDNKTLSKLRKGPPNPRRFINSVGGETINLHTIGISRQQEDRLGGGNAEPDPTGTRQSAPTSDRLAVQALRNLYCTIYSQPPYIYVIILHYNLISLL